MDWVASIELALKNADFLLLLLSPEAADSEMVAEEVLRAKELAEENKGKPIILPVRIRFSNQQQLPYHLSARIRKIQYASWDIHSDTQRLVDELMVIISRNAGWQIVQISTRPSSISLLFAKT